MVPPSEPTGVGGARPTTSGARHDAIVEQFTAQAIGFAASPVMNDEAALAILADLAQVGPDDDVIDLGCGPGIVAVHLARVARQVVGVDLTEAMLDLARARAAAAGCAERTTFVPGRFEAAPFPDASFSLVVARYTLHHAADPAAAAAEMARLVRPGGRVVVADMEAHPDPAVARRYDDTERLRDASHVRNLTRPELAAVLTDDGLRVVAEGGYRLDGDLEAVLARSSCPSPDEVRARFRASVGGDGLGVGARIEGGRVRFEYPIAVLVARR